MEDIRQGTLDFVLTKPEDAQTLISIREVRIWSTVDAIVVPGVVCGAPRHDHPIPRHRESCARSSARTAALPAVCARSRPISAC